MAIDFLAILNEQKKTQEEEEKASQKQKQSKGTIEPKKAEKPKKQKESPKKEIKKQQEESYKYPFNLYTEGRTVDISDYGFEVNKMYTSKEICDIMLRHKHFEFAGEMTFKLFEDDNTLVATAKQYKKG